MDLKNLSIDSIGLSTRSSNALHRAGVHTVGAMIQHTEASLSELRNIGAKSVEEIVEKISEYKKMDSDKYALYKPSEISFEEWTADEENRNLFKDWLKEKGLRIDVLEMLSSKSYNTLIIAGMEYLYQIAFASADELMEIPQMTSEIASEIAMVTTRFLRYFKDEFFSGQTEERSETNDLVTINDYLAIEEYRPLILNFVRNNDVEIVYMGLSNRSSKHLLESGYRKMSDLVFLTLDDLIKIKAIGTGSANEINNSIHSYLDENESKIIAYINGDSGALYDDETIRNRVLELYKDAGFRGLSLNDFVETLQLPEEIDINKIKKNIGYLIADKKLEYVDYRCYRVYERFEDYLNRSDVLDERARNFVQRRLNGDTLETIGQDNGITRERVRQIVVKSLKSLCNSYYGETGNRFFDEDYYRHLYENYEFSQKDGMEWFGISSRVWNYLEMTESKRGKNDLNMAITDVDGLGAGLRLKIKNYLNREKIFIDGMWVDKKRADLEEVAVRKFCSENLSFDEFYDCYNSFLEQEEIPYDEEIYYTEAVKGTRKNKLMNSKFLLWKQNEMIRYYDIEGRDFTELLDTLDLSSYENYECSTAKLMREHPEIMEQYDLRDPCELHNLLRKIVPEGRYHGFKCGKMPVIKFGEFDRDQAVTDIMKNLAPISKNDLVEQISEMYGYEPATIQANWLDCISIYDDHGVYKIDQVIMSEENMNVLKTALTDDFYFIREIKRIYVDLFPDADLDEINSYNLKSMGFICYTGYVIQHYPSADSYFRDLLTREEIIDIALYKKRFAYIQGFGNVLAEMKNKLDVVELVPNKIISFRKLEKSGITHDVICEFCDAVYDQTIQDRCFAMKALRSSGFTSSIFDYGFEDWFYSSLLLTDDRFSSCKMMGNIVLCKGKNDITFKSFLLQVIREYVSVDTFDLMNDLVDKYDCKNAQKYDVLEAVKGTAVYYDKHLDRLYANKDRYYFEIEQGGF